MITKTFVSKDMLSTNQKTYTSPYDYELAHNCMVWNYTVANSIPYK